MGRRLETFCGVGHSGIAVAAEGAICCGMKKNRTKGVTGPVQGSWRTLLLVALAASVFGLGMGYQLRMTAEKRASATETERFEIEALVDRYFTTWSAQDIAGYGACFHPQARIWYADNQVLPSLPLSAFLRSQEEAHAARRDTKMTEHPLKTEIDVRNGLASVRVHWELVDGKEITRGYDFFTLARTDGKWAIVGLLFNSEK